MLYLFKILTTISLAVSLAESRQGDGLCLSTSWRKGDCVLLRQCPKLYARYGQFHPVFQRSYLREYICENSRSGIKVCCEGEESQKTPNTHIRNLSLPESTTQTTTQHKNRRLLPLNCGVESGNKILGGNETALEDFPWMALLWHRSKFICGGALITPRYILTAAHCLKGTNGISQIGMVRLGEHNLAEKLDCNARHRCNPATDDIPVAEQIIFPGFNPRNPANDIALLRLARPAQLQAHIQPICLPLNDLSVRDFSGSDMWTAGWGKTSDDDDTVSDVKLKVLLPIVPLKECAELYAENSVKLTDKQICAGGIAGKDTCNRDSGGPLMRQDYMGSSIHWNIQGIVSFGLQGCGTENQPGVYTRVGKYLNWILDNIRE